MDQKRFLNNFGKFMCGREGGRVGGGGARGVGGKGYVVSVSGRWAGCVLGDR